MLKVLDVQVQNSERRNRNRLEIARDVLLAVAARVRKTRVMYQANLSYPLLEKYLNNLLQSGLVERESNSCYLITARGKEFLQMYAEFLELHRRIREEISGADRDRLLLERMAFNNTPSPKKFQVNARI